MSFKDDISEAKSKELNYFHKSNEDFADDIIESNTNCWSCQTDIPMGKKYCEMHCGHPADEFDSFTGQCKSCGKSLNVNMMMVMPSSETKATEAKIERSNGSMTIDGKQVIKIWESMQGWYWYAVEDQGEYTGVDADGNDVQAHAWFGYVQADFNEWGTFDSKELERAGVWTVPKSNWGWTGKMEESKATEYYFPDLSDDSPNDISTLWEEFSYHVRNQGGIPTKDDWLNYVKYEGGDQNIASRKWDSVNESKTSEEFKEDDHQRDSDGKFTSGKSGNKKTVQLYRPEEELGSTVMDVIKNGDKDGILKQWMKDEAENPEQKSVIDMIKKEFEKRGMSVESKANEYNNPNIEWIGDDYHTSEWKCKICGETGDNLNFGATISNIENHLIEHMLDGDESKASEANGYIAFYDGQQTEIYADTSYDAQQKAIDFFNPPESKKHTVTVIIAEQDGKQVTNTFTEGFIKDMNLDKNSLRNYDLDSLINMWKDAQAYYQNPDNTWEDEDAEFYDELAVVINEKKSSAGESEDVFMYDGTGDSDGVGYWWDFELPVDQMKHEQLSSILGIDINTAWGFMTPAEQDRIRNYKLNKSMTNESQLMKEINDGWEFSVIDHGYGGGNMGNSPDVGLLEVGIFSPDTGDINGQKSAVQGYMTQADVDGLLSTFRTDPAVAFRSIGGEWTFAGQQGLEYQSHYSDMSDITWSDIETMEGSMTLLERNMWLENRFDEIRPEDFRRLADTARED